MMEFLYHIDRALFVFFNQTVANPVFDAVMPVLTDLNKPWWGRSIFVAAWLLLFWRGGRKGRVAAVLLLLCVALTDQINSAVLKDLFHRARPCHQVDGVPVVTQVRLLVNCGSGASFPSSHAANNFAAAFLLSHFFRRWRWAFFLFATVIGFSRISVGVHYPFDVLGGSVVGIICAGAVILAWGVLSARRPEFDIEPLPHQRQSEP
jgi:undecaprenyl-diphosphatase